MQKSFTLLSALVYAFVFTVLPTAINASAQKNKHFKTAAQKDSKAEKKVGKTDKNSAKNDKNKKSAKTDKGKDISKNDKSKSDKRRQTAAEKRAELERQRKAEAERRARIEAERERRLEAERRRQAAIARQRAFENGLRTETQNNIAADDTRGEDLTIRQAAVKALGAKAGSVVVMDAQNGQIITAVNQKWAFGQGVKPCSTIKLVTGTAGVNEGLINQYGTIAHHSTRFDLTDALAFSDNHYFQSVGGEVGFDKMQSYAREYGLGQLTGINAHGESAGKIPEHKTGFAVNHMSSHGDDFEVTPLQLATMVAAIGNGGRLLQPQIARTAQEAQNLRPKVRRDLNVSPSTFQALLPGMIGSVNYGTGKRAADPTLNIGGKTGSCIGQGSWLGLFASIAPVANPKYAVVVVTRGQAERGKWAAAVAGQIYQALTPRIRTAEPLLAGKPATVVAPQPKVDPRTVAANAEEEDDSADAGELKNALAAPQNKSSVNQQPAPVNADKSKLVKPTVIVRPVGQPATNGSAPQIVKKNLNAQRPPAILVPNMSSSSNPNLKTRPRFAPN
jgi:penicillin-binding protein 2